MLYLPTAIDALGLDAAQAPYDGGEFNVYLAHKPAVLIGEIEQTASNTGAYTDNQATNIVAASHLQVVALTPILSDIATVLTMACLNNDGSPIAMNGVGTYAPPARAANQSYNFQAGYAVDLVPATPGKKFTAITSLTSIAGGGRNVKFGIYVLPEQADYSLVGCTTDVDFTTKSRKAQGVDCGMEADAFIKRGKTQPGELNIGAKLKGFGEGMARFDGMRTACMLVGLKDGQETCDRIVFTQWVPNVKPTLPDGEGEAMINATGKFAEHMFFVAP